MPVLTKNDPQNDQEPIVPPQVASTKQMRQDLDQVLQRLKIECGLKNTPPIPVESQRNSRERSLAITKIQEAIMWLGMDLKAMHEEGVPATDNPYPKSYDPTSARIEPTADGLKL
jgi:hypothetical protein